MKTYIKTVRVCEDYSNEEVKALTEKIYGKENAFSPNKIFEITIFMNTLQKIYNDEEKQISDEDLYTQSVIFVYHSKTLYDLVNRLYYNKGRNLK